MIVSPCRYQKEAKDNALSIFRYALQQIEAAPDEATQQCDAFVTTDKSHFLDKKQSILQKLKINVCMADSIKEWLPDKYKQEKLKFPKKK